MPVYVSSTVRLQWGWSVRQLSTSVGGPSLPLPPPSSLVGMLSKPLALAKGWGEISRVNGVIASSTYRIARHVLAIGAAIEGSAIPYGDLARSLNIPYLRRAYRAREDMWFSTTIFGVVSAPMTRIHYSIVFSDDLLSEGVTLEDLKLAAYSATHIGTKEGIVDVEHVEVGETSIVTGGETMCYTPSPGVKEFLRAGRIEVVRVWDPRDIAAYSGAGEPVGLDILHASRPLGGYVNPGIVVLHDDYPSYPVGGTCGIVASLP
ncbi:MAG: type I-A CRISPR-associated protein Cas5a [Desulfurococcales archaeon]|nr:type I-A CRISPR-associated protein Cas5a [Desulfurococcales archaeon]